MGQRCSLVAGLVFFSAQLTAQVCPIQTARLVAPDGKSGDWMGSSVSIFQDRILAGAQQRDGTFLDMGGGYVFVYTENGWTYEATLSVPQGHSFDRLGMSTAAAQDFMVIGSENAYAGDISSGVCYGFSRQPDGSWIKSTTFVPPILRDGDFFGPISLSASRAVVGALGNDDFALSGGAAFVFDKDNQGTWQFVVELGASDAATSDTFGGAVGISGDTIIVGADGDDDLGSSSGSAYIFHRDDAGVWTQEAKLLMFDGIAADLAGFAVAIDGDFALVGAPGASPISFASGAAYVFHRVSLGQWVQEAKLTPSVAGHLGLFGLVLDLQGDLAVVGSAGYNNETGLAFVFQRSSSGEWSEVAVLSSPDPQPGASFGESIALDSGHVVVGAPHESNENGADAGTVYVFDLFCSTGCTGDLNADGTVNLTDLATQLVHYGETSAPPQDGDLNGDGNIDLTDLAALLAAYGTICP